MEGDSHPSRPRRRARWVVGALLVVTAAGVLATRTGDGAEPGTPGVRSGGVDVDIVEPSGTTVRGPVVSSGRQLVAVAEQPEPSGAQALARSGDGGRSWEAVDLPGAPSHRLVAPLQLRTVGGLLVATATGDPGATDGSYEGYVWVSEDGDQWSGGLVAEATPDVAFGHVGELGDGALVTATMSSGELVVLTSRDQGRSWATADVPGVQPEPDQVLSPRETWRTETGSHRMWLQSHGHAAAADRGDLLIESVDGGSTWRFVEFCPMASPPEWRPCSPITQAGRLLLRGMEASVDGGTSWARAGPELPPGVVAGFDTAVELPGGGWLATARGQVLGGGGGLAWTLWSEDGTVWTPLLGPGIEGCQGSSVDTDEPVFAASPPVASNDGRAYLSFTCPAGSGGRSVAASFDRHDRSVDIVHEGEPDQVLLDPLPLGDDVVVPVVDRDRRLVQIVEMPA